MILRKVEKIKKEEASSFQKRTFNETRGLCGTIWNIEVFNSED